MWPKKGEDKENTIGLEKCPPYSNFLRGWLKVLGGCALPLVGCYYWGWKRGEFP